MHEGGLVSRLKDEAGRVLEQRLVAADPSVFDDAIRALPTEAMLESARVFGTPQYFLDVAALRDRASFFLRTMRASIPRCHAFYAFKCNDLPTQVRAVQQEGFHADVAGLFELQLALKLGFERILFSSPGKSREELALAVRHADRVTTLVDNSRELRLLSETVGSQRRKRAVRIGFRLHLPTPHGRAWSKFGFTLEELPAAIELVDASPALRWVGLHVHASWNKNPDRYVEHLERISAWLATHARRRARDLHFIDLGGGFYPEEQASLLKSEPKGVLLDLIAARLGDPHARLDPGFDPLAFSLTPVEPLESFAQQIGECAHRVLQPLNPDMQVFFEPGRFIATRATTILLTVTAVKGNSVIVDGGIQMLGDYKLQEYAFAPVVNLTRPSRQWRRCTVYGPLCDPHDLWGFSYAGEEAREGDVLAVLDQGAYTFSSAWRFIKAIPPYIALDGGKLFEAKKAETFANRYAGCKL
jgi:diaminopimelate decarboxylase